MKLLSNLNLFTATWLCAAMVTGLAAEISGPDEALERLLAGNRRYVAGQSIHPNQSAERRGELAKGQAPFAVVLACADSRVAPEILFDQGLGDLFVLRVAGHVVDNTGLGSLEYAVEHLHARLIVVLGHEKCGAVQAAVEGGHAPGHIHSLIKAIEPAVVDAKKQTGDPLDNAVRTNIQQVVRILRCAAPILGEQVQEGKIKIVGARYDLDTGSVEVVP